MKHRNEAITAMVSMLIIMAFVVGMRAGLHDENVNHQNEVRQISAQYQEQINNLNKALEKEMEVEHIEYEYKPLAVDYPTVESVDETDATIIAKTLYGEYRDASNYGQASAVVWNILNRYDAGYGSISDICTKGQYHGYNVNNPVDNDLYNIVIDVLTRWNLEKLGVNTDVGRTLPAGYLWFESSGGLKNTFRNSYTGGDKITP